MYYIKKRMEIVGSHCLHLDYEGKCRNMHGHNWIIAVYCKSIKLEIVRSII
jgi:6-pyruvoyltetrahydropterin/6-carboxytetrahydropterin synthase